MTDTQNSHNEANFKKFWLRYLRDHAQQGTRFLHFLGSGIAICALVFGVITLDPAVPALGVAMAYAFAWAGHLLIERNRPSMIAHPWWSLVCDVRMFRLWISRRLHATYVAMDRV
jgi:hypothetical protein